LLFVHTPPKTSIKIRPNLLAILLTDRQTDRGKNITSFTQVVVVVIIIIAAKAIAAVSVGWSMGIMLLP